MQGQSGFRSDTTRGVQGFCQSSARLKPGATRIQAGGLEVKSGPRAVERAFDKAIERANVGAI